MADETGSPQVLAREPSDSIANETSFRFTPVKALRAIPRLWERKPATPFQTGVKRKLWKRFQTSFSSMQTVDSSAAKDQDALQAAINTSKDAAYVRGVKRLCVATDDVTETNNEGLSLFKTPFLETKWDSEASRKRRKLPESSFEVYQESTASTTQISNIESSQEQHDYVDAGGKLAVKAASPVLFKAPRSPANTSIFREMTTLNSSAETLAQIDSSSTEAKDCAERTAEENDAPKENTDVAPTPTKIVRGPTQAQKVSLVRSALRSTLSGEDAMLLDEFLSKAQAKREAKAAVLENVMEAELAFITPSVEDSPCSTKQTTPRPRRALEDLTTNSPSPTKAQISPSKIHLVVGNEAFDHVNVKPLRRMKKSPLREVLHIDEGTEFIFLKNTEAQVALTTRRNTKVNRGSAVMPKYVLMAMAQEESSSPGDDTQGGLQPDRVHSGSRKTTSKSRKTVTWNEERMVEYEGGSPVRVSAKRVHVEEYHDAEHDTQTPEESSATALAAKQTEDQETSDPRTSRSKRSRKIEAGKKPSLNDTANEATAASTTPRSRRVRRLGDSAMTSETVVKTGSGRVSRPPAHLASSAPAPTTSANGGPLTPTKPRRKLVPKSPSSSAASSSTVKAGASSAVDQPHFASGIPTRSTGGLEGAKRKSIGQANAGCTPMPKRVRQRS
ncbi:hypothetical protein POX_a01398 [Penicillium oxalicum]|uniref:hypothetical protein n=1 Tax=Penicillium oxalicum TaxID=69781 RepID=UPI0020B8315E|nr:hypothetical protein POX_a01398 [Penicillium oxalicum]KAI2794797.1 hypothetical protein POX_a01398 [Penicillium oxalicum]